MNAVAVLQSNYIPWKGYFDIVNDVDLFVFYDDVQYSKNDWRNRNRLKTPKGSVWVTIPVGINIKRLICDVVLSDSAWQKNHWGLIQGYYSKCRYFRDYKPFFEHVYLGVRWENLSKLNQYLIVEISRQFLGIKARFADSRDYALSGKKMDRLLELVTKASATRYISGPSAKDYIDAQAFSHRNIELVWKDYSGYPEYPQLYPPFDHYVSILDVLFNVGPESSWFIWGWRSDCEMHMKAKQ